MTNYQRLRATDIKANEQQHDELYHNNTVAINLQHLDLTFKTAAYLSITYGYLFNCIFKIHFCKSKFLNILVRFQQYTCHSTSISADPLYCTSSTLPMQLHSTSTSASTSSTQHLPIAIHLICRKITATYTKFHNSGEYLLKPRN
eukprot:gene7373-511_t